MIIEKNLDSWKQLKSEIDNLVESLGERSEELLFRGQANSTWKLDTTAERKAKNTSQFKPLLSICLHCEAEIGNLY